MSSNSPGMACETPCMECLTTSSFWCWTGVLGLTGELLIWFPGDADWLLLWSIFSICFCTAVLASKKDLPRWISLIPFSSRSAALGMWPFLIAPLLLLMFEKRLPANEEGIALLEDPFLPVLRSCKSRFRQLYNHRTQATFSKESHCTVWHLFHFCLIRH